MPSVPCSTGPVGSHCPSIEVGMNTATHFASPVSHFLNNNKFLLHRTGQGGRDAVGSGLGSPDTHRSSALQADLS